MCNIKRRYVNDIQNEEMVKIIYYYVINGWCDYFEWW